MKLALAALLLFSSVPAAQAYESQSGYAKEQKCFKKVYRERYIPGTMKNPGYVKTERKRVRVPCQKMFGEDIWREPAHEEMYYPTPRRTYRPAQPVRNHVDNNDCSGGTVAGGILGGGAAAAMSRGDGRWWAIPLGVVGGAMVGCQIDGG
tara:strand:- start:86 stop:535 length:450 start_codon:yes stop_codon:yes gene_type:complete